MMNKAKRRILILALLLPLLSGCAYLLGWLFLPSIRLTLLERITGNTPAARTRAYVEAVLRGDEEAALAAWELPSWELPGGRSAALAERRQAVTCELIAADLQEDFLIRHTEWWNTCCEPGVICDSRNAGGARISVQFLDQRGLPAAYVFDVFHRDGPYWGAAASYPPRHWVLRDVYARGQEPLFWRMLYEPEVRHLSESSPTPAIPPTPTPAVTPPLPTPTPTPILTSTVVEGWFVYRNEFYDYEFSYPPETEISTQGVTGYPTDELPDNVTPAEYIVWLSEIYPDDICVGLQYGVGFITIQPPPDQGGKYGGPCGVTGVGDYDIADTTETVMIDEQAYLADGWEIYERDDEATFRSEFFFVHLEDGTRIDYGGYWADEGATYEDYLPIKETLLQILASYRKRPGGVPPATPTPIIHVIQEGDTVLSIAAHYDVSVEAILAANDTEHPYFLQVGQILIIPTGEESPGTDAVIDCAAVYPGLPGCLQDEPLAGGRLAFVDTRLPFNYRTTVIDLERGSAWTLGETPGGSPRWSPTGDYVLITLGEGASAVYRYNGDVVATYGIPMPTAPFWAPPDAFPGASDWLARPTEDGALEAIPFPEGQPRQLLPPGTLGESSLVNVRWSPDGRLAWTLDPDQLTEAGRWEQMLYVRPVEGEEDTTAWRLSDNFRETYYHILDWAPGARLILAGRGMMSVSLFEDGGSLVTINADTGEITDLNAWMLLTPEAYAWHPTQPGLLALAEGSGRFINANKRLALLDVTTGDLGYLTGGEMAAFEPAWSPDGTLLAYAAVSASPGATGDGDTLEQALNGRAICVINPQTGETRALTHPGDAIDGWPQWAADGDRLLYTRQHDGYSDVRVVALDSSSDALLVTGLADPTCFYGGCDWRQMLAYSPGP